MNCLENKKKQMSKRYEKFMNKYPVEKIRRTDGFSTITRITDPESLTEPNFPTNV